MVIFRHLAECVGHCSSAAVLWGTVMGGGMGVEAYFGGGLNGDRVYAQATVPSREAHSFSPVLNSQCTGSGEAEGGGGCCRGGDRERGNSRSLTWHFPESFTGQNRRDLSSPLVTAHFQVDPPCCHALPFPVQI